MQKIKIKLKPVGIDAHLKYRCPRCDLEHWVSLQEAQTKNFIVVCDCKKRFFIRTVKRCKLIFRDIKKKQNKYRPDPSLDVAHAATNTVFTDTCDKSDMDVRPLIDKEVKQRPSLSEEVLFKAMKILVGFGFTSAESKVMLTQEYAKNPTEDYKLLIKNCISNLET